MKRMILMALAFIPAGLFAQGGNFTIKAKIGTGTESGKAYLVYKKGPKMFRDSVEVHDGAFEMTGTVNEPTLANLSINHGGLGVVNKLHPIPDTKMVYLENGTMNMTAKDSLKNAVVSGSKINEEYKSYQVLLDPTGNALSALQVEFFNSSPERKQDKDYKAGLQAKADQLLKERQSVLIQYVKKHPASYLSLVSLMELKANSPDLKQLDILYKGLSSDIRETEKGKEFVKSLSIMNSTMVGAVAPDFTLNDANDKPVSLSSFRGKYVLLDFWASWCGPCRKENPNVVKAFNQYKDKNFTVLGVSLDQPGKKGDWLAAIKADDLEWTQVCDFKYWDSQAAKTYEVKSIPENYLIGPDGKIIGKNLRGEELQAKLASLLN